MGNKEPGPHSSLPHPAVSTRLLQEEDGGGQRAAVGQFKLPHPVKIQSDCYRGVCSCAGSSKVKERNQNITAEVCFLFSVLSSSFSVSFPRIFVMSLELLSKASTFFKMIPLNTVNSSNQ